MSGRIFQNVVLQFKETTDRTIGVIDSEGTVIACSELTGIGKKWTKYVEPIAAAEGNCVTMEGKTFKPCPAGDPTLIMRFSPAETTAWDAPYAPWPAWR